MKIREYLTSMGFENLVPYLVLLAIYAVIMFILFSI